MKSRDGFRYRSPKILIDVLNKFLDASREKEDLNKVKTPKLSFGVNTPELGYRG
jgi:hypothetical protein